MDRRTDSPPGLALALLDALAVADPELGAHSSSVAELAGRVARRLGLPEAECEDVRLAAALHDVGKLALPESILQKPGPLDADEWKLMRMHTVIGERLLGGDLTLARAAVIVRASHERFDGGGYPDALTAASIPVGARIVAVCDAYEAMVTDRPYRPALPKADAVAELRRCVGTQFDGNVVEAFLLELTSAPTVAAGPPRAHVQREKPPSPLERIRRLDGLLEAASGLRSEEDLPEVLDRIAATLCDSLGFGVAVFNLYRPAWDDFVAGTIHGPEDVRQALLGSTYPWEVWSPLLDDRFLRRGAYVIAAGTYDWSEDEGNRYIPELAVAEHPDAWHPEDEIFVPCYHSDGHLLGVLNVGHPLSGLRPTDDELDALVVVAKHAARAVQGAQEAAVAAGHRRALEHLLQVSAQLSDTLSIDSILGAVCDGIERALGFGKIVVYLIGEASRLEPVAAAGFSLDDPALDVGFSEEDLTRLLAPEFEDEGCFLLSLEEVQARVVLREGIYRSQMNGRGAHAWDRHWLIVPLHERDGRLLGAIMADEPADRRLPSRDRLQALRLFANQAATSFESLRQFEEVRALAERDPLTRLLNRRAFMHRLEAELSRCEREGVPLALVFCDLDGFKQINDNHGHEAGDRELIRFAGILTDAVREEDEAFRLGGDEFAVLLPGCTQPEAVAITGRITSALGAEPASKLLSASFGTAVAQPGAPHTVEELLREADRAMYETKRAGLDSRAA